MSYSVTHHSTAIFGSVKATGQNRRSRQSVAVVVVVVEHAAATIFIYASETLDAELGWARREEGRRLCRCRRRHCHCRFLPHDLECVPTIFQSEYNCVFHRTLGYKVEPSR